MYVSRGAGETGIEDEKMPDRLRVHDCTNPQRRRIEKHDETNAEIWESPEWKATKAKFLIGNPKCCRCGGSSQVPHHPNLEVYGKPEYLDLRDTQPYCHDCHSGEHRRKFKCTVCGKIMAKSEGERCFACLEDSDKQRIKSLHAARNESKNRANRRAYRACHPRKEVINGVWTTVKEDK